MDNMLIKHYYEMVILVLNKLPSDTCISATLFVIIT